MKNYSIALVLILLMMFGVAGNAAEQFEKKITIFRGSKASLGVLVSDLDAETAKKIKVKHGALIVEVLEGSEAERIGLKSDDIITKFMGKSVKSTEDLKKMMDEIDEEGEAEIVVKRNGKSKSFTAKLKPVESSDFNFNFDGDDIKIEIPEIESIPHIQKFYSKFGAGHSDKGAYLGVEYENLSDQLLEYFEVKHGVLVKKVVKDSPAEKAGLKAGDIITKIGDKDVKDGGDLVRIMNYYDPEDKIKVYLTRKGKNKNMMVTLAKKRSSKWLEKIDGDDDVIFFKDHHGTGKKQIFKHKLKKMKKIKDKNGNITIDIDLMVL